MNNSLHTNLLLNLKSKIIKFSKEYKINLCDLELGRECEEIFANHIFNKGLGKGFLEQQEYHTV